MLVLFPWLFFSYQLCNTRLTPASFCAGINDITSASSPLIRFVVNWKATQETKHMLESTALPCGTRRAQIKENRELSVGHLFELNCQDSSCFYLATVSLWVIPRIRSEATEATVTNWDTVTSQMFFFELLNPLGFKATVEAEVFQIEIFTPNVSKIQHFQNCIQKLLEISKRESLKLPVFSRLHPVLAVFMRQGEGWKRPIDSHWVLFSPAHLKSVAQWFTDVGVRGGFEPHKSFSFSQNRNKDQKEDGIPTDPRAKVPLNSL